MRTFKPFLWVIVLGGLLGACTHDAVTTASPAESTDAAAATDLMAMSLAKDGGAALKKSAQWKALVESVAYQLVVSDMKHVRHDGCRGAVAPTAHCQILLEQLRDSVAALVKAPEYQALEHTPAYATLRNDARAAQEPAPVDPMDPKYDGLTRDASAGQPAAVASGEAADAHHRARQKHHRRGHGSRI